MADEKDTGTPPESGGESDAAARSEEESSTSPASPSATDSPSTPESPASPDSVDEEFEGIVAGADDSDDDDSEDDDSELVGVGAQPSSKRANRSEGESEKPGRVPVKKDRRTPKQRAESEEPKRVGPIGFVKGSIAELKKVVYPTGSQLGNYFVVVLVFVLIIIGIVTALDAGFGWLVLRVFT